MENLNIKSISERVKSETPKFWKKVRRLMVACAAVGAALVAVKTQYAMEWLPDKYCQFLIVIGAVGASLSSLTAEQKPEEK